MRQLSEALNPPDFWLCLYLNHLIMSTFSKIGGVPWSALCAGSREPFEIVTAFVYRDD